MDMIVMKAGYYARDGFSLTADFAIARESITALIGPSGAGKSTILNILAGFDHLQKGNVFLDGQLHNSTLPALRPVNFVFQDHNSFAHLTARQNVAIGVHPRLKLKPEQWRDVDNALHDVGIGHLTQRKPGEMSGGERQRIALARALMRHKPILLLDEAFSALGPALREDMLLLVQRLKTERQLTVLMVTHDPHDAKLIADQVMFVAEGQLREPEATPRFFKSKHQDVRRYLGTPSPAGPSTAATAAARKAAAAGP
jgi:thiamine transport system ATP-binding protein